MKTFDQLANDIICIASASLVSMHARRYMSENWERFGSSNEDFTQTKQCTLSFSHDSNSFDNFYTLNVTYNLYKVAIDVGSLGAVKFLHGKIDGIENCFSVTEEHEKKSYDPPNPLNITPSHISNNRTPKTYNALEYAQMKGQAEIASWLNDNAIEHAIPDAMTPQFG